MPTLPPPPPPPPPPLGQQGAPVRVELGYQPETRDQGRYLLAILSGFLGGPIGAVASPLVMFFADLKGEFTTKRGQRIRPFDVWLFCGLFLTPMTWLFYYSLLNPRTPAPITAGADAQAWLSRCAPAELDTTTAYDVPRPSIVTRTLSYPSQGVQLILVPRNTAIFAPPPYQAWTLVGFTDPSTNQPMDAAEARRRMGSACSGD